MSSEKISPNDYTDMRWNIHEVPPEKAVTVIFPQLYNIFQEFEEGEGFDIQSMSKDQVFRFIIYTYHKKSPLVRKVQDIFQRKQYALFLCGVKSYEEEEIKDLFGNDNRRVVDAVMQFLKFEGDMDYMALALQIEAYYSYNQALISDSGKSLDIKNRASIFKTIQDMKANIDKMSEKVFHSDNGLADYMASQRILEERRAITPEENARKRQAK